MRLVSYNILDGGVGRADPLAEVLSAQDAEVVTLVEADDDWVAERIARRLKMDCVIAPGRDVADGHVHRVAVLSRWPVLRSCNHALIDPAGPRAVVEVELMPPGGSSLTVVALHLTARATLPAEAERVTQVRRVLAVTQEWRAAGRPHVLMGDFNANAPDQRIDLSRCKPATRRAAAENGGTIPRDAIALLLEAGYTDTLAAACGDEAFDRASFTTHEPGQRVDYVFAHGMSVREAWIETDRLATFASDHYPVGVELHWPPARAAR